MLFEEPAKEPASGSDVAPPATKNGSSNDGGDGGRDPPLPLSHGPSAAANLIAGLRVAAASAASARQAARAQQQQAQRGATNPAPLVAAEPAALV